MNPTNDVLSFARKNGGVIATHEVIALGLSPTALSKRVKDGILVRLSQGIYCLPGTATTPDLMLRAACRALGAVVSHESAAAMHLLHPIKPAEPSVTVAHRSTNRMPGVRVHQSTDLLDAHTTELNGIRITNIPRTLVDLSKVTGPQRLERLIDNAVLEQKTTITELSFFVDSIGRRGKKGIAQLRRIVEARSDESSPPESELEAATLQLLDRAGLPSPVAQFRADWLKATNGRVDFAYPVERIVIEVDGRRWHSHRDAFEKDRRRDNAAQLAGWIVLRFTYRMVTNDPVGVASTVRAALAERATGRTRG